MEQRDRSWLRNKCNYCRLTCGATSFWTPNSELALNRRTHQPFPFSEVAAKAKIAGRLPAHPGCCLDSHCPHNERGRGHLSFLTRCFL